MKTTREMLPALGARVLIHVGVGDLLMECVVQDYIQSVGEHPSAGFARGY